MLTLEMVKTIRKTTDANLIEVALKLLVRDPSYFNELLTGGKVEYTLTYNSNFANTTGTISGENMEKFRSVRDTGEYEGCSTKVVTIKAIRDTLGLGLREAKHLCEALALKGYLNEDFAKGVDQSSLCATIID